MALPKWLKKENNTPQKEGRKFEKRYAKKVGGRTQPGSGMFPHFKEDVVEGEYLVQLKYTTKKQFTLKLSDLEILRNNALKKGMKYKMVIHMGDRSWVIEPQI